MEQKDIDFFKKKIEDEMALLEKELSSVGRKNPENPNDWEATMEASPISAVADANESADTIEEYEENTAILKQLEIRFNELKGGLQRIKDGTYGLCEKGNEPIEQERLKANPAARTCKAHME